MHTKFVVFFTEAASRACLAHHRQSSLLNQHRYSASQWSLFASVPYNTPKPPPSSLPHTSLLYVCTTHCLPLMLLEVLICRWMRVHNVVQGSGCAYRTATWRSLGWGTWRGMWPSCRRIPMCILTSGCGSPACLRPPSQCQCCSPASRSPQSHQRWLIVCCLTVATATVWFAIQD